MPTRTAFALLLALLPLPASAEYAIFDSATDTIAVSGQTVLGSAATFEAVVMFPTGTGANGAIFEEWTDFAEDKQLQAGPSYLRGFVYSSPCCLDSSSTPLSPDVFHHVAYVLDGAANEERFYVDGALAFSRATTSFDASDADGMAQIGGINRGASNDNSFIGVLDSLRISDVARYSGSSFTPPAGDMTSDANTLLLYNFDDAPGSTTVADSGPLNRTGTLGQGFGAATSPVVSDTTVPPEPTSLGHFLCYKTKQSKGDVCSIASALNAGAACQAEADCGGNDSTDFCVANKLPAVQATLTDPLAKIGHQVDVTKGVALCNPADKNGGGIGDPDDHLRSFAIKLGKGQQAFPTSEFLPVVNQFGALTLRTLKVDRLLVPAAKDPAVPVAPPEAPAIDHFRCQKVKVAKGQPKFVPISEVSVVDQFAQPKLFDLKKPTRLCTPVDKNGEGVQDATTALLCYQAKPGPGQPKHVPQTGLHVAHQFGVELVDTVKEEELCVPSTLAID